MSRRASPTLLRNLFDNNDTVTLVSSFLRNPHLHTHSKTGVTKSSYQAMKVNVLNG